MANWSEPLQKAYESTDAEMKAASGKVSDVCRNVGLGAIAIFYALLLAEKDPALKFYKDFSREFNALALFGAATFLFDYLQYIFSYIHLKKRLSVFQKGPDYATVVEINKSQKTVWKSCSIFVFNCKNVSSFLCCLTLVYIMSRKILSL